MWGVIGRQSAMRLDDDALEHFAKVRNDRDLNDDMLGWKVRAALRDEQSPLRIEPPPARRTTGQ